ncbi:MAG TPA: Hsp20/alpha crystallin family protein [Dissulfurispiraceae bacterium]|nr:Hsp20/alpha crystallin family protein [Dissulfurispiraceae bacterium]
MKRIAYYLGTSQESQAYPVVDLFETADELVFEIELPGIDAGCVNLQVIEHYLVVECRPHSPKTHEGIAGRYLCMERQFRSFRRILSIPIAVNIIEGTAHARNGVITVRFPKLKGKIITIPIEYQ